MTEPKKSKLNDKISKPSVGQEKQDKVNLSESQEAIAIVGMSGRFAKSANLQQLWQHLAAGDDLVEEATRWELADYDSGFNAADTKKGCSRFGSFVEDMDKFDPLFFNISGIEAKFMDPQHRLFLEEAWRALEDASALGAGADLSRCGVYAGCSEVDYLQLYEEDTDEKMPPQAWWGNSNSILAARIAYHLDMQGPAVAIDTACSSSLVAIHLACQGLRLGEIDMALAGGVTLMPTANFYLDSGRAGMLSTKGHCHTFDAAADGFVPGEGVGVVVLKRLSSALAAGDQIYGVIKGSGMNQDGASNGIVAPRGIAQEQLERDVYDRFSIQPEQIDYVEAHGTGTALGDPIEFRALTNTFRRYTQKKNFCGIGSIKTNIGHTLTAAGVAGVIKVLLSLQHKKLPPSLHFQKGNPAIDFDNSPFFVTTELTPWEPQDDRKRLAAISSFGFSGTNAHVVIEEAPEPARTQATAPGYLIVLSANNDAELKQQAQNLCEFLTDESVADISFSLLTGRRHFLTRLAVVAQDTEELKKALAVWLDKGRSSRVMAGTVTKSSFKDDKPLKDFGNQCIAQLAQEQNKTEHFEKEYLETLSTVAQLFIQGFQLQFSQLFQAGTARKISLPTYPFARGSYWFDKADLFENKTNIKRAEKQAEQAPSLTGQTLDQIRNQPSAQLHPLLHENTSTCFVTRFSSTFTGAEFFFADHQVQGNKVLPGVAHLEMARAAIAMAMELDQDADQAIELSEVVWRKPVVLMDSQLRLHIELTPRNDTELQFHIYSLGPNEEEILYSQGVGCLSDAVKPRVDIASLQRTCQQNFRNADDVYPQFLTLGLNYGAGHQGLVSLRQGLDDQQRPQVFALLRKPETLGGSLFQNAYVLHPGMLDSALQASIGLSGMVDAAKVGTPLPFALASVAIYRTLPEQALAWVRYSAGCQPNDPVQKLDISVCDEQGNLCVEFKGFSSRILKASAVQASQPTLIQADTLLFQPEWQSAPIEQIAGELKRYNSHHVLLVSAFTQKVHAELEQQLPASITCKRLVVANGALVKRYTQAVERVFADIQQLVASRSYGTVLVQVVISAQDTLENACFAGLSGLLKTAAQENPKLYTQCILLSEKLDGETLSELIQTNAQDTQATEIRYQANLTREVKSLTECANPPQTRPIWKNQGVYLITGGLGGLGLIFAREIAAQATQATVILTGRSALDASKQREIDQLIQAGLTVDYQIVNVAERDEVDALLASIQKKYTRLTAIVHSAGVIQDNFIQTKTQDEIRQVLAPKVAGLVYLDEASQEWELEQFICFSSSSGAFGNPGQADYAAANAFMDAYAHYRNELCARGQRSGQTLSINWPLWKLGGMQVHPAVATALSQKGLSALPSEQGIEALYRSAALGASQVLVLCGQAQKIRGLFAPQSSTSLSPVREASVADSTPPKTEAVEKPVYDERSLLSKVQNMLLQQVAGQLKISLDDLDLDSKLSEFGFDSISLTEMGNELNERFQITLTPTIFFEYPTLGEFAGYLAKEHGDVIAQALSGGLVGTVNNSAAPSLPDAPVITPTVPVALVTTDATPNTAAKPAPSLLRKRSLQRVRETQVLPVENTVSEPENIPIAIIGISGCFPGAADVEQFWQNLEAGKDCISEIPADRWDWQSIYGDPATEVNKTNIKWGGFIEGVDQFDSLFFGISPREAISMDPQQRLLMTHAWQAIEDAGYAPGSLSGSDTAVIVGTVPSGYSNLLERSGASIEAYTATGMAASVGPNRISYLLNLHGPSEPIETACSSSLVAIHRAVELIRKGRCGMAIAGGINTLVTPDLYIAFSKSGMLCEDGRCKTFSAQANGYVRGEGAGMLLLKSLPQAERDGDHIYGTILASSENHGGRANSLTAPNPNAQADLLVAAYREAGIDPRTVTYIEAHGTGTELGDPVEINGLKIAFKKLYQAYDSDLGDTQCGVGSVKSNIGHLELSAGVAGVIKVLMQMKHQTLAKSLHCETLNPYIDLKDSPFYIVQEQQEWKNLLDAKGQPIPRRAGVSSFGFGGVNAHVVLEEYLPKASQPKSQSPALSVSEDKPAVILLSAKNSEQLLEQARNLLRFVSDTKVTNADLLNIAYTLQVGRDAMDERLAFLATSVEQLILKLKSYEQDASSADLFRGSARQGKEAIAIFLQDDDAQELTRNWLEKGKYEKLLKLWVKGLNVDWAPLYREHRPARISLPTYPFARNSYWVTRELSEETDLASAAPAPAELGGLSQESVQIPLEATQVLEILKASAGPADKRKVLLVYLRRLVAKAIQISEDEIDENGDFASDYGVDSMAGMMLIREIKNDLDITLYPRELAQIKSLSGLVEKMLEVFDEVHGGKVIQSAELPADAELNSKVEMLGSQGFNDQDQDVGPIGFILSNPRSGSTLLRTMLAGHPELFAPPELHLLNYATMQDRDALLKGTVSMSEGLQRAFMELHQMDADASRHYQQKMVDESWSIADVYGDLIQSAKGRLLIDKSPSYAGNPAALARAEVLFKRAKYIHLVRHPYAVIESFTRMRMDKLLSDEQVDRYRMAEEMWTRFNQNIEDFFAQVPDDRKLVVHYEELIKNPEATLQAISRFLEVEFHPEMLNPYANGRMTDGIYKESAQIGDPNFLNHNKIESDLADSWKNIQLPRALQVTTQAMAQKYGYALPSTEAKVESVPDAIPHVNDTISHVPDTKEYMVDVNGVTLAVCEWGNPEHPAVLCVHGLMDQGLVWKPVARDLVAQGYRVIAPDLRGHGRSAHLLPDERYYDVDAFVQDLKALVDHLRIERFNLVGHSLGSVIAARLAASYPDHVQALILVETILIGADKPSDEQEYSIPDRDRFAHQPLQDIESAIERLGIFMPSHNEGFLRELAQRATVEATGGELMWRWDEQLRKRQFFSGPNAAFQFRKSYLEQLSAMAIPTLVLQADKSGHRRAADQKILNRALAHARSVQMRGGHNLHLEDPVTVAETIFSFIQASAPLSQRTSRSLSAVEGRADGNMDSGLKTAGMTN